MAPTIGVGRNETMKRHTTPAIDGIDRQSNRNTNGHSLEEMLRSLARVARAGTHFDTGGDADWANDVTADELKWHRFFIRESKLILKEASAEIKSWQADTKLVKANKAHSLALLGQRQAIVKMAEAQLRLHGHSGRQTNAERWESIVRVEIRKREQGRKLS